MIARQWTARADKDQTNRYPVHFRNIVLPALLRREGFVRGTLMASEDADGIRYIVFTVWQSMEAIRDFTGGEVTRAVVEPNAAATLREYDAEAIHFTVLCDESVAPRIVNKGYV